MARLSDIIAFSEELLKPGRFKDYCLNGLQIEGDARVSKIVSGVTASQALINGAIERGAGLILVHHGFFWRNENPALVGIKKQRFAALIKNDVSLLAYHLPLDAHPKYGNNVQLAERLSLKPVYGFGNSEPMIGLIAEPLSSLTVTDFAAQLQCLLGRKPVHLGAHGNKKVRKVGICTGAAQDYFPMAIKEGVDVFVTGEASEQSYHMAIESGVDYFAAGHHATERYGVQAVGQLLAEKFDLEYEYLEINNPV